jgi:hypothetical protein
LELWSREGRWLARFRTGSARRASASASSWESAIACTSYAPRDFRDEAVLVLGACFESELALKHLFHDSSRRG